MKTTMHDELVRLLTPLRTLIPAEHRAARGTRRGARCAIAATGVAVTASILSVPGQAEAAGFAVARFGAEHGHPMTDNPTAIYYNPAGIADRTPGEDAPFKVRVFIDGNFALRAATYQHAQTGGDLNEPSGAEGANYGSARLFNVAVAPMIGATFKIDDFALGAAFYVPFGGASSWGKNDAFEGNNQFPGAVDGVQRWATIDGVLRSSYISFAAAYDIAKYVSVGASFNLVMSQVQTVRARTVPGLNDINTEGRSLIDVSGLHGAFGVGVLAEPIPGKLWIGASYQSQPGLGEMKLNGTLRNNFGGAVSEDPVTLFQSLPDVIRLGGRGRPTSNIELRLFGDVTMWNRFDKQCLAEEGAETCDVDEQGAAVGDPAPLVNIARDWDTSFGIRAGVSYWPKKSVEVFGGLGYDSNAVPDSTLEPALTDFHKGSLTGGARFQIVDEFLLGVSYTHLFYAPRDTTGEFTVDDQELPTKVPDFGGKYTQTVGVINAHVELTF